MIDIACELKKEIGGEVLENEPLSKHCTFQIGGRARYFVAAKNDEEVLAAVGVAQKFNLPIFVFGGGSNVLFSDKGFDGLVIKMQNAKCKIKNLNEKFKIIEVGAGVRLGELVAKTAEWGLAGLEWAAGIPGTVGGAIRGNAGAYGHSISEVVEEAEVLGEENHELRIKNYGKDDCRFGYRDSIFKHDGAIILEVILRLEVNEKQEGREEIEKIIKARNEKLPLHLPSAGCIFKNIEINSSVLDVVRQKLGEELPDDFIKKGKIPAAWLIEQCGFKGRVVGGAVVAERHANFILNNGATAKDVVLLIDFIKQEVMKKFGLELKEEIERVGFN